MTQDGGYDLQPPQEPVSQGGSAAGETPGTGGPKPGDPDWVPPVPVIEKADEPAAEAPAGDPDVEQFKGLAILAYICFLIPLIAAPNSKFARFHANQGLLTFILLVVVTVVVIVLYGAAWLFGLMLTKMKLLDTFFSCGVWVLQVGLLVGWIALVISGIINAANGERKELPIVGHFKLIK
jgi:uncharacterized membrane protein